MKEKYFYILLLVLIAFCPVISSQNMERKPGNSTRHFVGRQGVRMNTPHFNRRQMLQEDSINGENKVGGMRFAKQFTVDLTPENSGESFVNPDSSMVWKFVVKSDSAYSINLFFSQFHLAALDTVFVYNTDKTRIISLTEKNNLKSGVLPLQPVDGDELTIEYRRSSVLSPDRKLKLGQINHAYRNLRGLPLPLLSTEDICSAHTSCVPEIAQLKQSVCLLIINGNVLCSGTLVNNTAQNGKPYVLTSAHCLGENDNDATRISRVPSIVAFFNYEAPNCTPSVKGSFEFTIGGATLKAMASDMDMLLVELSSMPPKDFRPYYAGWNTATSPLPPFRGIHHPFGTVKRMAQENEAIFTYSLSGSLINSHWRVARWDIGTTQPGSSGSGLFDKDGLLVGALTGGNSVCASPINDYYYRINKAWSYYSASDKQLKAWLDPINSGTTSMNGFNPYGNDSAMRTSNMAFSEVTEKSYLQSTGSGSGLASGQNSLTGTEYAEKYSMQENAYIYGVYLMASKANANYDRSSQNKITVRVYTKDENADAPKDLLASKVIDLKSLQWSASSSSFYYSNKVVLTGCENYIRFDVPVAAGKDFFISYDVPYTNLPADSFAIFTAKNRTAGLATAYAKQNSIWKTMIDFAGLRTSLWVDPVVSFSATSDVTIVLQNPAATIFPNPATDKIIINLKDSVLDKTTVVLFDYMGKRILSKNIFEDKTEISLNDVPHGIYLLRIINGSKTETHKIIKR